MTSLIERATMTICYIFGIVVPLLLILQFIPVLASVFVPRSIVEQLVIVAENQHIAPPIDAMVFWGSFAGFCIGCIFGMIRLGPRGGSFS